MPAMLRAARRQFWARDEPGAVVCAHGQVARLGRRVYGYGTCQLFVRRGASARLSSGWGYPWRATLEPSGSLRLEGVGDSTYDRDVIRLFPWWLRSRVHSPAVMQKANARAREAAERTLGVPVAGPGEGSP